MKKITLKDLKQYLQQQSHEELARDIVDLYGKLDAVKDYYQLKLVGVTAEMIGRYKASITKEFFPARGMGQARLSVARKAVMDYKKISNSPAALADLMLFYVETGVNFTNQYGDIDEPFYNSMETMYERAVQLIVKENLQEEFESRCKEIVDNTRGIGWGFHDGLSDTFDEYFK